jgi:hypothetical protein
MTTGDFWASPLYRGNSFGRLAYKNGDLNSSSHERNMIDLPTH